MTRGCFIRGESRDMWLAFAMLLVVAINLVVAKGVVDGGLSERLINAVGDAAKVVVMVGVALAYDTVFGAVRDLAAEGESEAGGQSVGDRVRELIDRE